MHSIPQEKTAQQHPKEKTATSLWHRLAASTADPGLTGPAAAVPPPLRVQQGFRPCRHPNCITSHVRGDAVWALLLRVRQSSGLWSGWLLAPSFWRSPPVNNVEELLFHNECFEDLHFSNELTTRWLTTDLFLQTTFTKTGKKNDHTGMPPNSHWGSFLDHHHHLISKKLLAGAIL